MHGYHGCGIFSSIIASTKPLSVLRKFTKKTNVYSYVTVLADGIADAEQTEDISKVRHI